MKILYHHRTLSDGAEGIHIAEMVEAFQALGHEVVVHALTRSQSRGDGEPSGWGNFKSLLPHVVFELAAIAYNVVDYVSFRAAIRRHRPALIYKRHALHDVGAVLAARTAGVPLLLEVNVSYSSSAFNEFEPLRFRSLGRWLEQVAMRLATVVAVVSSPLRDIVLDLGTPAKRVLLLPNGANPSRFSPRSADGLRIRRLYGLQDATVIGWSGILREWHHVDLLLPLLRDVPDARLLVVGDGPDRARLERIAQALGVSERVIVTGRVPHSDMPDHLAAFDVAVASDDRTGFASPMKILEYMAMARAVVAPRMPNIEDFLEDNRDGLLFEPGDQEALRAAVRKAVADVELRRRLGESARARVEQDRNWRHNAEMALQAVGRFARCDNPGLTTAAKSSSRS